jgi:hypothetical protein
MKVNLALAPIDLHPRFRGIAERGFAPMSAGGIHPRSEPRGIVPSQLNLIRLIEGIPQSLQRRSSLHAAKRPIAYIFICIVKNSENNKSHPLTSRGAKLSANCDWKNEQKLNSPTRRGLERQVLFTEIKHSRMFSVQS